MSVSAFAQCFLIHDLILFGESLVWKCVIHLFRLTCSGVMMDAIFGEGRWYCLRQLDACLMCVSKRFVIDLWSVIAFTLTLDLNPKCGDNEVWNCSMAGKEDAKTAFVGADVSDEFQKCRHV